MYAESKNHSYRIVATDRSSGAKTTYNYCKSLKAVDGVYVLQTTQDGSGTMVARDHLIPIQAVALDVRTIQRKA